MRKPAAPWDVGVESLLRHLEAVGFDRAPRALGTDQRGRSVVSFIGGDTHGYPMPAYVWADESLVAAARLIRSFHDATEGFAAPPDPGWQGPAPAGAAEVICHNDLAPYNLVYRSGRPFALIDFEMAAPGPRVWDLAYAAYRFVPLRPPSDESPPFTPPKQARRLGLFLASYDPGLTAEKVLDQVPVRLAALRAFMSERAIAGDARFARHLAEGDADLYLRDARYVEAQRRVLLEDRND